jgi:hypothetical protein
VDESLAKLNERLTGEKPSQFFRRSFEESITEP